MKVKTTKTENTLGIILGLIALGIAGYWTYNKLKSGAPAGAGVEDLLYASVADVNPMPEAGEKLVSEPTIWDDLRQYGISVENLALSSEQVLAEREAGERTWMSILPINYGDIPQIEDATERARLKAELNKLWQEEQGYFVAPTQGMTREEVISSPYYKWGIDPSKVSPAVKQFQLLASQGVTVSQMPTEVIKAYSEATGKYQYEVKKREGLVTPQYKGFGEPA